MLVMLYFVENLLSRFLPIKKTLKKLALLADDYTKVVFSSVFSKLNLLYAIILRFYRK